MNKVKGNQPPQESPILSVQGVSKSFGGIQALKNISLDVYDREVVALLGDNGAGKSTLIKIISGVYSPDNGQIFFNGEEIDVSSPKEARSKGIKTVYQNLATFDILDVTTNVFAGQELTKMGFLQKNKMDRRAKKALKKLGISVKSLRQETESLSGGQQHAVAIASTVYVGNEPQLIIMDEPTAGLGVKQRNEVLELVEDLGNEFPVIFITHDLQNAFRTSNRAVVLHNGSVNGVVKLSESSEEEIVRLIMGGEVIANK